MADYGNLIYGYDQKVPTKFGLKRYLNLDNAASTPPFKAVMKLIAAEGLYYSSIHRGAGYKSRYMTHRYEESREIVRDFVRADPDHDVVIFTKNTTDSINKIRHYLPYLPGESVIYTRLEHHSNELPWMNEKHFIVELKKDRLDLEQLETILKRNRGKVKLLAVTGASNVTGYLPPIHTLAEMAHSAGARILVDAAQLAPHRPITVYPAADPRHLDFLAFSGHKMYAPFGSGVLIGPKRLFSQSAPSQVGGGTVKAIDSQNVYWVDPPGVEEAGSPNVFGALAIAESCRVLNKIGWRKLIDHEQQLLEATLLGLKKIPGVTVYNESTTQRVGVISFNAAGIYHQIIAEALSEYGIGVRTGCFCARNYVKHLLGLDQTSSPTNYASQLPGMVRVSFGCYNNLSDVSNFLEALEEIVRRPNKIKLNNS
ncbi:MAG: aminotransferase class V-fold PLP-dependent enzyme [Firmicutes bacterium]|nr:aminotransferase class V-fold PLP-dependent enzyme [Bacillota bacterium]